MRDNLYLGDRGHDVEEIQKFLKDTGYLKVYENGYGVFTKRAVYNLQKSIEIAPTGIWTNDLPELFNIYNKLNNNPKVMSRVKIPLDQSSSPIGDSSTPKLGSFSRTSSKKGTKLTKKDPIDCYIINLLTNTMIEFTGLPEEVTIANTANFSDQTVKGRSSPFKAYENSGSKNIDFSVLIVADYCEKGITQVSNEINALVLPSNQGFIQAPKCLFKLGEFINIVAVPNSVSQCFKPPYRDGVYTVLEVTFSLSEIEPLSRTAEEVESSV